MTDKEKYEHLVNLIKEGYYEAKNADNTLSKLDEIYMKGRKQAYLGLYMVVEVLEGN